MKATMAKYTTILQLYYKLATKYKANLLAKLVYMPVRITLMFFLWFTIYKYNDQLEIRYIVNYYIIALLITQMYPYIRSARDIEKDIIEGTIASYFTRPVGYLKLRTLKFISQVFLYLILTSGIIILVVIVNKVDIIRLCLFILMLAMGVALQYLMWTTIGITSFWLEKNLGVLKSFETISSLCAGSLIPLSFFSKNIQNIINLMPFRFTLYVPINILLDDTYQYKYIATDFLVGGLWLVAMVIVLNLIWKIGCRNYNANFS